MKTLPYGAKPILDARLQGKRPADLLIVSLVGALDEMNPVVLANPDRDYDWRWMRGLKACVFAKPGVRFFPVVRAIGQCAPEWLGLWDVESNEGADCIVHLLPESLDKRRFEASDYGVIFWPWVDFENKQFRGE
ncbi:hypothetical protein [Cupriavidus gilardii]|uniref:hypothetical protein n=1 Tax=Cupriavidus gilardii TaxID=82541 RepID=UPI0021BE9427|nr:hypothetical protein [Cupriavidus gilardii]MCT9125386.1 hypothetical protein [Cupriavidus gilardii]